MIISLRSSMECTFGDFLMLHTRLWPDSIVRGAECGNGLAFGVIVAPRATQSDDPSASPVEDAVEIRAGVVYEPRFEAEVGTNRLHQLNVKASWRRAIHEFERRIGQSRCRHKGCRRMRVL